MKSLNNHTGRVRGQHHSDRLAVLWLTGMTDEQLSEFQFNMGLEWLGSYLDEPKDVRDALMKAPMIWAWWKNEWAQRDSVYLEEVYKALENMNHSRLHVREDGTIHELVSVTMNDRLSAEFALEYRKWHQRVFTQHYPPYALLDESWKRLNVNKD